MSFYNPLALLGLLAIPVIVLIYIIKNRYVEQVVSSTYIWTLSEKFLKRRLPINKLVGLLSLILQILMILFISFGMARPVFAIKNAAYDYVFVLDASASMNMSEGGERRFDKAKSEIYDLIDESIKGSTYTLILADGRGTELFGELSDKESALKLLSETEPSFMEDDLTESIQKAQEIFNRNNACRIYAVTDREIETTANVELINVRSEVENYSLTSFETSVSKDSITVNGELLTHTSAANLELSLYLDDEKATTVNVEISEVGIPVSFVMETELKEFKTMKVVIENEDALALDNEIILYDISKDNSFSVLIVSEKPFFLEQVFKACAGSTVESTEPKDYPAITKAYDLYVYDSFVPEALPSYGAVWFFNPTQTIEKSGFVLQEKITEDVDVKLEYSTSTQTTIRKLTEGLLKEPVAVKVYQKVKLYKSFNVLATSSSFPAIFAGINDNGNRQVVFNFDVHDSDIAVNMDFVTLTHNLVKYLFPIDLDENLYYVGDVLEVNVLSTCKSVKLSMPSGKEVWLDTSTEVTGYDLSEVGTHTITITTTTGEKSYNVFVSVPESERTPVSTLSAFVISGEPSNLKRDSYFDDLWYLFMMVAILAAADWMVYCYEQYKLR